MYSKIRLRQAESRDFIPETLTRSFIVILEFVPSVSYHLVERSDDSNNNILPPRDCNFRLKLQFLRFLSPLFHVQLASAWW